MTKESGLAHKAVLSRCIMLQGKQRRLCNAPPCRAALSLSFIIGIAPANAECGLIPTARICPEETVTFLRSQLSGGSEAGRVAALGMLVTLCHSDGQCHRPGTQCRGWGWGCWAECRDGLKMVHVHPKEAATSRSRS